MLYKNKKMFALIISLLVVVPTFAILTQTARADPATGYYMAEGKSKLKNSIFTRYYVKPALMIELAYHNIYYPYLRNVWAGTDYYPAFLSPYRFELTDESVAFDYWGIWLIGATYTVEGYFYHKDDQNTRFYVTYELYSWVGLSTEFTKTDGSNGLGGGFSITAENLYDPALYGDFPDPPGIPY